jgi:hypothetical protein
MPDRLPRLTPGLGICDLPGQHRDIPRIDLAKREPERHPQEAVDCACGLYLADPAAWT